MLLLLKCEGTLESTSHKPFGLNSFAVRHTHCHIICCLVFWRFCRIQPNQLKRSNQPLVVTKNILTFKHIFSLSKNLSLYSDQTKNPLDYRNSGLLLSCEVRSFEMTACTRLTTIDHLNRCAKQKREACTSSSQLCMGGTRRKNSGL